MLLNSNGHLILLAAVGTYWSHYPRRMWSTLACNLNVIDLQEMR